MSHGRAQPSAWAHSSFIHALIHSFASRLQLSPTCDASLPFKALVVMLELPSHSVSRSFSPSPFLFLSFLLLLFFSFVKPGLPLLVTSASRFSGPLPPIPHEVWPSLLQLPLPAVPAAPLPPAPPRKPRPNLGATAAARDRMHLARRLDGMF